MPDLTLGRLWFFIVFEGKKNETKKQEHLKHEINY